MFLVMDFGWNWLKNMLTYNYIIIIITAICVDTNFVIFVQWVEYVSTPFSVWIFESFHKSLWRTLSWGRYHNSDFEPERAWLENCGGTTYRSLQPTQTHSQYGDLYRNPKCKLCGLTEGTSCQVIHECEARGPRRCYCLVLLNWGPKFHRNGLWVNLWD